MSEPTSQTKRASAAVAVSGFDADPGSIIRSARLARGETQRQTGEACGYSQSEISRIENGKAHAYDIRTLARLAQHLDIPPQILGLARTTASEQVSPVNRREFVTGTAAAVAGVLFSEALRDAGRGDSDAGFTSQLLRSRWLGDNENTDGGPLDLTRVAQAVAQAKSDYQACRYAETAAELPRLLAMLDGCIASSSGDELLRAEALAADAYHVAASLELKLGNEGPAWMAADASMRAAQRSGDPVMMASSARIITHALMDAHRYADAETVARRMAERLASGWSDPSGDALSVYGTLLLRGAIAAARAGNGPASVELLDEARDAADRLGRDCNLRWTAFGPTNVLLHQINVAVTLGNAGVALEYAESVRFHNIPITERRASFLVDVASAYLQWGKYEQACNALCAAERCAPQELSGRPVVRQLITDTWNVAPTGVSRRLEQLARRCGVTV